MDFNTMDMDVDVPMDIDSGVAQGGNVWMAETITELQAPIPFDNPVFAPAIPPQYTAEAYAQQTIQPHLLFPPHSHNINTVPAVQPKHQDIEMEDATEAYSPTHSNQYLQPEPQSTPKPRARARSESTTNDSAKLTIKVPPIQPSASSTKPKSADAPGRVGRDIKRLPVRRRR